MRRGWLRGEDGEALMKRLGLPAGAAFVAASALVTGCAPSGDKAAQKPQPPVAGAIVTAGPNIRPCTNGDPQPSVAFLVKLTGNLDVRNIQAVIKEMDANTTYPNGNPNTMRNPPAPTSPITKLDLNLQLQQPGHGNTRTNARIIVQLEDPTITFHGDDLAINSLDDNGKAFLCFRSSSAKQAIVDAEYRNGNGSKPNYGTMNINLIVPDTGGVFTMPISLDPEIKNNG